jgi:hypothetical protein
MAAGLGFKTFAVGEVLSAASVNGYLMQGVLVFASAAARDAAITSPQEGQFAFTKDNDSLWYYSGSAWVASGATGDIEGVTAGTGISGGGTSGTVTITNSMATAIDAKGDLIVGTGADTFSRLAVGATNGHILQVDSAEATGMKWAAAAAGGTANWSLLNAGGTALTGAQTVTVSGISGKDQIMVLVDGASSATASSLISVRLNGDTGSNYYVYGSDSIAGATYAASNYGAIYGAGAQIRLAWMSANAGSLVGGYVLLSGCNSSGVKVYNSAAGATAATSNAQQNYILGGYYNSSSTISSVSVFSSSGNLDAGTVYVYASA